jgi:hypothetical protein
MSELQAKGIRMRTKIQSPSNMGTARDLRGAWSTLPDGLLRSG